MEKYFGIHLKKTITNLVRPHQPPQPKAAVALYTCVVSGYEGDRWVKTPKALECSVKDSSTGIQKLSTLAQLALENSLTSSMTSTPECSCRDISPRCGRLLCVAAGGLYVLRVRGCVETEQSGGWGLGCTGWQLEVVVHVGGG
eukprot:g10522.t1